MSNSRGNPTQYDDQWDQFSIWIGKKKARQAKIPQNTISDTYMVISDLHIPFQNKDAVFEAIEHGRDNKIQKLIIAGDTADCYSLSRFAKYQNVAIKDEYIEMRKFFDYASRAFKEVIVLAGNHEVRERKHFSSRLTPDELEWLLDVPILQRCVHDIPNVSVHKNMVHNVDMNWFITIGDVVVGHPERSSSVHFKPVEDFRKWINMWGTSLGFTSTPRLVVIGHTHQAGITFAGNTMLVENGCLCQFQEYALQPNLYPKPQRLAFTTFGMKNNRVDIGSVKQFYPFADK